MQISEKQSDLQATLKLAKDIGLYEYKQIPQANHSPYISNKKISRGEWKIINSKLIKSLYLQSQAPRDSKSHGHKKTISQVQKISKTMNNYSFTKNQLSQQTHNNSYLLYTSRPLTTQCSPRKNLSKIQQKSRQIYSSVKKRQGKNVIKGEGNKKNNLSDRQKRGLLISMYSDIAHEHQFLQNPEQRLRFINRPKNKMPLRFNKKKLAFQFK